MPARRRKIDGWLSIISLLFLHCLLEVMHAFFPAFSAPMVWQSLDIKSLVCFDMMPVRWMLRFSKHVHSCDVPFRSGNEKPSLIKVDFISSGTAVKCQCQFLSEKIFQTEIPFDVSMPLPCFPTLQTSIQVSGKYLEILAKQHPFRLFSHWELLAHL